MAAIPAPASHATGRQRGDGSRPSGNSSSPKVASGARPATQIHVPSHAASVCRAPRPPSLLTSSTARPPTT